MEGVELPEGLPAAFCAAIEADKERLVDAMAGLEQLPQGEATGLSGAAARRRLQTQFCKKYIDQKCNELDATNPNHCPSFVEAAQLLRLKVQQKHGSSECLAKAQEAMAAEAAEGSSSGAPSERTVAQLMANQLAIQRAHRAVQSAEQAFCQTAEAERVASERRAAAARELEEVGCLPLNPGCTRRTDCPPSVRRPQANERLEDLQPAANKKPRPAKERPPHYEKYSGYTVSTWLREEGTAMGRRAHEIEPAPEVRQSARGTLTEEPAASTVPQMTDGPSGWRHHWRHGMVGAVRYWAGGSRANVVKMLVGLAGDFGVKDDVGQQLDPQRDSIAAERAIARNVKGALAGLKPRGGSAEEQRSEYGV
eukprot:7388590-Prymnesium_polylepis.1